jgi:trimeric autotransporter adhesin
MQTRDFRACNYLRDLTEFIAAGLVVEHAKSYHEPKPISNPDQPQVASPCYFGWDRPFPLVSAPIPPTKGFRLPAMRSLRFFPLSVVLASSLFAAAATAQEASSAVRIVNPIDEKQLVTLKGTMHPLANAGNDHGAAPDGMQLDRIHLVLKRSSSQETALRALIADMHTPGTASYHKWLTPDAFGKQFGPSDQDLATVEAWLTSHGFSGAKALGGRQVIEFSGNAGQFRSTFHTQIHKYEVNGESRYANAADPQIPAALAPVVGGFASLNNFRLKSLAHYLGKASYNPKTDKAIPAWTYGNSSGVNFVLAPGDYAVQYDLNPLYLNGTKGAGQSIAIIDYSNVNIQLVNNFRTLYGLPVNPPQVIIDGNDPGIDGINDPEGPAFGTSIESYLDVEWAGAVAPAATIDLVIAADSQLESGGFLAAERAVYSNIAPILSSSIYQYGCEQEAAAGNQFIEGLWEQAAAQGITVLEAAGDSGSAGCDGSGSPYAEGGLGVNNWASTPFNVAVGGTDFFYADWATGAASLANYWTTSPTQLPAVSLLKPIPEQPWNDSQFGLNALNFNQLTESTSIAGGSGGASNCATGSGTSSTNNGWATCTAGYAKPSWQSGAGVPSDKVRDLPDVSLYAADGLNYTYVPICASDGDCEQPTGTNLVQITGVGGTSAAAPSFAGIMALVNEKYGPQGQANYVLYPMKTQFPAAFHDVTNGTNSVPCDFSDASPNCIEAPIDNTIDLDGVTEGQLGTGTTADYNAAAGYNLATGLGTVDAANLVADWNKVTFTGSKTTLAASETSFTHGTGITISGNVTGSGTPSGDVALLSSNTEPLQQGQTFFTLSGGAYSSGANAMTTLPGGSYNIWAKYAGDTKNGASTSTPIPITVTPENSGIYFNVIEPQNGELFTVGSPVSYGQVLTLSAEPTPSSQLAAVENCTTSCPIFTEPTGTVSFADNGTALNTAVLNAEGDAEYTLPTAYNVGAHSVTASYSGDQSYNPSTAAAIAFTVVQSPPSVFITGPYGGQSSYTQGQTSTLTVAVEGFGNGAAPTGSVSITGAPAGTPTSATLSAGVDPELGTTVGLATVTIPATAAMGTYNISATYTPTGNSVANYGAASTASAYPVQITAAGGINTTTTGTASAASTSPTAVVTVNGTVKAASGAAPTGSVTVYFSALTSFSSIGVYPLGTVNVTPGAGTSSTFSFSVNSQGLLQGANQLTLQYNGGGSDNPSTAVVNIANPLSDFSLVPASTIIAVSQPGDSGTVPITLTSVNGYSGTIALSDSTNASIGVSLPASVTLAAGGSQTFNLKLTPAVALGAGTFNFELIAMDSKGFAHTLGLQLIVAGTSALTPGFALSNSGNITVNPGATTGNTSTISVTPSNGFTGAVALTCTIVNPPPGIVAPSCTIPTSVTVAGTTAVTGSLAIVTTTSTTPGAYTFSVTGTSGSMSESTSVEVVVNAGPSFSMSNSGNISVTQGGSGTSTITVTPTDAFTGTVDLTCTVTTSPAGATSPVTCGPNPNSVDITAGALTSTLTVESTGTTTAGAYVVTVTGKSGSITQTSIVNVNVNALVPGTFNVSATTASVSSPGESANSTVTVATSTGYAGTVTITCALTSSPAGAQFAPTCSGGASPISLSSGTTSGTTTVTLNTTAATSGELVYPRVGGKGRGWAGAGGGAVLALLLFFGIPARRRSWRAMLGMVMLLAALGGLASCGGGSGGGGGGGTAGTTTGTYTFTVTGTGNPTQSTGNTATFTLTVN